MNYIVLILLLSLPSFTYAQIERTWVAVESRPISTSFIVSWEGHIFHFDSTELTIVHVFSDSVVRHRYHIDEGAVILNDSTSAVIKHLSADSMLLESDKRMVTLFYPVEDQIEIPKLNNQILTEASWRLDFGDYQEVWHLTEINSSMFPGDVLKVAVNRALGTEFWNVTTFRNYVWLTLSNDQFDLLTYQVVKVVEDTLRLKPFDKWLTDEVYFIKSPTLPASQLSKIRERLSKTWRTSEIIASRSSLDDYEELDAQSNSPPLQSTGVSFRDTLLISQQQFYEQLISWQFNADLTYCMLVANNEYVCGTWQLLPDGQTIKLDEGTVVEQYIDLVEVTDRQLIISNSNNFSIEPGSNHYITIYYTIKLE